MTVPPYCCECTARLPPGSAFCPICGAAQTENDQALTGRPQQLLNVVGTGRQPTGHLLYQRYRLLHAVGQGGMGAVYMAQDTQLGDRPVAIKEMSMSRLSPQDLPQAVKQFRHEASLLASLHHPNLPVIHECFYEQYRWYLVMSFIEGQNLQATLDAAPGKRLPVREVVRIGIELCEVLEYLHTHEPQIIFRDLKPLNIMLVPQGHICLIDFGIARHFKQEQTKDTASYYSVGYAPPEQYGQAQTDPRSDIYSLGATLHQMLTGHHPASRPFQFPNVQLVDPTVPMPLASLIAQMLEMNEYARPASAAEVRARLEKVLAPSQIAETAAASSASKPNNQMKQASLEARSADPSQKEIDPSLQQSQQPVLKRKKNHDRSGKRSGPLRVLAWLGFIGCILAIGVRTDIFIAALDNNGWKGDYGTLALSVAGLGACLVGLIFLFTKKRPLIDVIGGWALITFGNLVLLTFLSGTVASCVGSPGRYVAFGFQTNCLPFQTPVLSYVASLLFLSMLMLSVGACLFLRRVNAVGGLLLGVFLLLEILLQWWLLYTYSEPYILFANFSPAPLPTILSFIWLPPAIIGCVTFIVTLIKMRRSKKRRR